MRVIALVGAENTGKSHTINLVYAFLLREGFVQIPGHFRVLGNPRFEDFIDILEKDGKRIGFVGMGDYIIGEGKSLKSLLDELMQNQCHLGVCACRDNPKILSAVLSYSSHLIFQKTNSTSEENNRIVNVRDAIRIIESI